MSGILDFGELVAVLEEISSSPNTHPDFISATDECEILQFEGENKNGKYWTAKKDKIKFPPPLQESGENALRSRRPHRISLDRNDLYESFSLPAVCRFRQNVAEENNEDLTRESDLCLDEDKESVASDSGEVDVAHPSVLSTNDWWLLYSVERVSALLRDGREPHVIPELSTELSKASAEEIEWLQFWRVPQGQKLTSDISPFTALNESGEVSDKVKCNNRNYAGLRLVTKSSSDVGHLDNVSLTQSCNVSDQSTAALTGINSCQVVSPGVMQSCVDMRQCVIEMECEIKKTLRHHTYHQNEEGQHTKPRQIGLDGGQCCELSKRAAQQRLNDTEVELEAFLKELADNEIKRREEIARKEEWRLAIEREKALRREKEMEVQLAKENERHEEALKAAKLIKLKEEKKAAEEAARLQREAEEARRTEKHQNAIEEEMKRKTAEEEMKRKTAEEEMKRKTAEEEMKRKVAEEEMKRKTAEERPCSALRSETGAAENSDKLPPKIVEALKLVEDVRRFEASEYDYIRTSQDKEIEVFRKGIYSDLKKPLNQAGSTTTLLQRSCESMVRTLNNAQSRNLQRSAGGICRAETAREYAFYTLASHMVQDCDIDKQISRQAKSVWVYATIAATVSQNFSDFRLMFSGVVWSQCCYAIPHYYTKPKQMSFQDFCKLRGAREGEKEALFFPRMASVLRLFLAFLVCCNDADALWNWFARILQMPPRRGTVFMVLAGLETGGYFMWRVFGKQFQKIILYIQTFLFKTFISLKDKATGAVKESMKDAIAKLEVFLQNFSKQGLLLEPEGSNFKASTSALSQDI